MDKKGFSLIELLVVVAVIGILAAVAVPAYIGQQKKAARSEAASNLQALRLLEEQFFAENGRYTASLGAAGTSVATRDANVTAIQTTAGEALPGFKPGNDSNFCYNIVTNSRLVTPATQPPTFAAPPAGTPCFAALATGITGTRVAGDVFAIDCNNNSNF